LACIIEILYTSSLVEAHAIAFHFESRSVPSSRLRFVLLLFVFRFKFSTDKLEIVLGWSWALFLNGPVQL